VWKDEWLRTNDDPAACDSLSQPCTRRAIGRSHRKTQSIRLSAIERIPDRAAILKECYNRRTDEQETEDWAWGFGSVKTSKL
jgi:hypothetical protein